MTKEEALKMLETAPRSVEKKSALNQNLTQDQAVTIVVNGIKACRDNTIIPEIFEKRVYQVCKNQKHPKYKRTF